MKIQRGDYEGASQFAYFDKPVDRMTPDECRSLLACILFAAMPGAQDSEIVYHALEVAEQISKEQSPA